MGKELTDIEREAGKLKHKRLMTTMQIVIAFVGVLIGAIFLYDTSQSGSLFIEQNKLALLVGLGIAGIVYTVLQNSALASLERVLGWKDEFEDKKIRLPKIEGLEKYIFFPNKTDEQLMDGLFGGIVLLSIAGLIYLMVFNLNIAMSLENSILYIISCVLLASMGAYLTVSAIYTKSKRKNTESVL